MFTRRSFLALLGIAPAAAAAVKPELVTTRCFVVPQNPVFPMPPLSIGMGDYIPGTFHVPQQLFTMHSFERQMQIHGLDARGVQ